MLDSIKEYLKKVEKELQSGNTTEHSHRPHLKTLIESFDKTILAINEPKRVKCGAPDFIVVRGQTPLGYIEAKDVGIPLSNEEKSEQMTRYRSSLSNLILTDYLEFRWYVNGERRLTARVGETSLNRVKADGDGIKKFLEIANSFLTVQVSTVGSQKELAQRMAALARLIRETIEKALSDEDEGGTLRIQMKGFREVLLHDLSEEQFADMYAQSICYGLFAARCNSNPSVRFTREHAAYDLPKTNPFLRKMFSHIAGPDLDDRVVWVVDDLAELLHHCDMSSILQDFGKRTRREDPVVHFYETFLSAYNPKMREMRGVYYTPEPVVSYIVRSVDQILKKGFGLEEGLADATKITVKTSSEKKAAEFHKVQILDPACGTGTFLYGVVDQIHEFFKENEGMWSGYVSEHLLPRLWGFELLMAPYAVAHMKLGLQLRESGYDFKADERLRIYLTNTLEEAKELNSKLPFVQWIAEEANTAGKVKLSVPVMVVLGNPPYSVHSANKGDWIERLLKGEDTITKTTTNNYFAVDGQPLREQNPKNLYDDYVKFIRFAQWRIEQTGHGVLAFISNHGYLDNPTFRGMRQSLMNTFPEIYVLDLHGSSKRKELAADGSKDENVFDIQQGVAIGVFVRRPPQGSMQETSIQYAEIRGLRKDKYIRLSNEDILTTSWLRIEPRSPFYLFIPQDAALLPEYEAGWKLDEVFPLNSTGVKTHRDHFAFAFDAPELRKRVEEFKNLAISDEMIAQRYGLKDTRDWKLSQRRRELSNNIKWEDSFTECLYRPFDVRYYYDHPDVVELPRQSTMRHMTKPNLGLVLARIIAREDPFDAVLVTQWITELKLGDSTRASYILPLYLYSEHGIEFDRSVAIHNAQKRLKESGRVAAKDIESEWARTEQLMKRLYPQERYPRFPNLHPDFLADVETRLSISFIQQGRGNLQSVLGPEDAFHYIYAILNSPTYRKRYHEFLKMDFPRLPLTSNLELFRSLCSLGKKLVDVHLLRKDTPIVTRYPVQGDHLVDKVRYSEPAQKDNEGRVWINKKQCFKGVPPEVWNFHVGGYQVCEKWLKDRKGRKLSFDDLEHYQKIVSALAETIRITGEIDVAIENHGGFPIQ